MARLQATTSMKHQFYETELSIVVFHESNILKIEDELWLSVVFVQDVQSAFSIIVVLNTHPTVPVRQGCGAFKHGVLVY